LKVLVVSFSPNSKKLASGDMKGEIVLWDPMSGKKIGKVLKGH